MIRSVKLVCAECGENFVPQDGVLYYKDNYINNTVKEAKFICPACIKKWHDKWHIKSAGFSEVDYVMTVTIELEDGTVYEDLDCTPMDGYVVAGVDIPPEAQKKLYEFYHAWDMERKRDVLKYCHFKDEFMRTSFSCETYGGEKYEDVAFRVNIKGIMETAVPVPDYILKQIIDAYSIYELQNRD